MIRNAKSIKIAAALALFFAAQIFFSCGRNASNALYDYKEFPLERNGIALHLDCVQLAKKSSAKSDKDQKNILLVHGVTYSSHEFDIDYKDYSLVKKLARSGWAVWRLDIAGFGRSQEVSDGFMPDSDYAAQDINAAVQKIVELTGQDKIDVLGWSWGTVTVSRFAADHSDRINKLVLYAPITSGIGDAKTAEPFHHNTWEHAADDFQRNKAGAFDYSIAERELIEIWCSSCWRYDGEKSPNGGRRDICVPQAKELIDLAKIQNTTLVICGDKDPYLNYKLVKKSLKNLPKGSDLQIIKGGSHVVFVEAPYYRDFQKRLLKFLEK